MLDGREKKLITNLSFLTTMAFSKSYIFIKIVLDTLGRATISKLRVHFTVLVAWQGSNHSVPFWDTLLPFCKHILQKYLVNISNTFL